ncbi:unnamed protein product [Acanthoscelides obtectus]|uniref:Uncharacterized protein n=1 Tax=Acanthoscelides obtectus TaxID=200917 RepID=A0A9P0Q1F5_ACAOB|nr:unnamed protein product [Acanthoscelides obtectus]CAK1622557.1 hypothetical protein AOBTE_LOCUS1559 [Acanthoscelides obtectus]
MKLKCNNNIQYPAKF